MSDIEKSRQAILDFLQPHAQQISQENAEDAAQAASKTEANSLLHKSKRLGKKLLKGHPLKSAYTNVAPLAEDQVRRSPWLSLGVAAAAGALMIVSPGSRRLVLRYVLPFGLKK